MMQADADKVFAGSIPAIYATHLVPVLFESYADDLARRAAATRPQRLLEIAAGTGVVTRALVASLPETASIVASDLNQAMLDQASATMPGSRVEWRQADAMALPFADASFDTVVCQFGSMFFPDRMKAFSEVRRVLRSEGTFIFSVWDRLVDNEFADLVERAMELMFPADPPRFLSRAPHGYYEPAVIQRDVAGAGFGAPSIETVAERSRAESARVPAIGFCEGTPLRAEIEARDPARLAEATDRAAETIARRFGNGPVDARMQALVVTARPR
jgi:ubiquinone/menaquinone biosynthesis C-methylase UbiE